MRRFASDRMIPQRLILKNFLSYRAATLDFRGLHTACICGANGAGKSSLLEAIIWAIWGQSRAASEDDVIHIGAQEAQVDFIFTNKQQTYRIIRSRYRGQATTLEFQVVQGEWESGGAQNHGSTGDREDREESYPLKSQTSSLSPTFRTLTAKGVRATQQLILEHLKLDYETFINSAYLRQGRADEFMLKRPGERKEILADLLKLGQYDSLTDRAKDRARQLKGQIELLERNLERIQTQLQESDQITQEQANLEATLFNLQQQQQADSDQLQTLQASQHQRQTWQQQLTWQQQQERILMQDCLRFQRELEATRQQQQALENLLQQEGTITAGYRHLQSLQEQEETFAETFKAYQHAQTQRQQYQQKQSEAISTLQSKFQHLQAQLEGLQQQSAEIQHSLNKAEDIKAAMENLRQARTHLERLDQVQVQASPLIQRRQQLQTQLDRIHTRLTARLEELHTSARQLQSQQQRQPKLEQAVIEVRDRIETLEQRRLYQQQVLEKGLERRSFMERLQAEQRNYETQLAEVEQKIQLLRQEGGEEDKRQKAKGKVVEGKITEGKRQKTKSKREKAAPELPNLIPSHSPSLLLHPSLFPPCPLCDRPLDEHHLNLVLERHQIRQQEILDQIWVIREQLAASEREIQILRQEYRELDQEINEYDVVLERRGQLQEQLQATIHTQTALQQITTEVQEIERSLQTGEYASELQVELQLLDATLSQLNYDEKDHALARGEVDRWRWAEIRQAEIKQAQRRQDQIAKRQPELEAEMATLQNQLTQLQQETANSLATLDRHITALGYSSDQHDEFRRLLREAQPWQLHYQELCQARQLYPQVQQRVEQLLQTLQERQQTLQSVQTEIHNLAQQLETTPIASPKFKHWSSNYKNVDRTSTKPCLTSVVCNSNTNT